MLKGRLQSDFVPFGQTGCALGYRSLTQSLSVDAKLASHLHLPFIRRNRDGQGQSLLNQINQITLRRLTRLTRLTRLHYITQFSTHTSMLALSRIALGFSMHTGLHNTPRSPCFLSIRECTQARFAVFLSLVVCLSRCVCTKHSF